jgi:hypothetical protein
MTAITRHSATVARYLLGAAFTVFGLNGFFHFIPMNTPPPAPALSFFGAMMATGYLFQLIKATEVIVGLLLLSNRFVPLALTLLAPVMVNILLFHAFLAPSGLPLPIILLAAHLYAAWSYRDAFAPMLRSRVEPAQPDAASSRAGRTVTAH